MKPLAKSSAEKQVLQTRAVGQGLWVEIGIIVTAQTVWSTLHNINIYGKQHPLLLNGIQPPEKKKLEKEPHEYKDYNVWYESCKDY